MRKALRLGGGVLLVIAMTGCAHSDGSRKLASTGRQMDGVRQLFQTAGTPVEADAAHPWVCVYREENERREVLYQTISDGGFTFRSRRFNLQHWGTQGAGCRLEARDNALVCTDTASPENSTIALRAADTPQGRRLLIEESMDLGVDGAGTPISVATGKHVYFYGICAPKAEADVFFFGTAGPENSSRPSVPARAPRRR